MIFKFLDFTVVRLLNITITSHTELKGGDIYKGANWDVYDPPLQLTQRLGALPGPLMFSSR